MLKVFCDEDFIRFKFSSEIKLVNHVIQQVKDYLKQFEIDDYTNMVLVLRELLNNAIEHGNKNVCESKVTASIERIGDRRFKIMVEDEGVGFDYKNTDLMLPDDPSQIRKRGLCLINAFSDQLEFNSKGNCATVYLTIRKGTEFLVSDQVIEDISWKVIKPTGDITAEIADKFRTLLLELVKSGHWRYRFDLSEVEDIDSVILSIFIIFSNMISEKFSDPELEFLHVSKDIANLFRLAHLDETYAIR
ncbi:ATP-binding protein [Desulfococcaceae bacterium HSG8]|nr:ATP-binding protein [Desulfococcaceae bacterium HSG8]